MDKRGWPWKRKSSSEKAAAEKAAALFDSAAVASPPAKSQADKDNYKKPNYVQISVEQYSHLSGLEEQVRSYEEQVRSYEEQVQTMEEHMKELDEQLTSANAEITAKDNLAKQHAKVAEDAVSGWEKAEAEALALKNHLETFTLSKLTAEDRAAHLDGALKECMRQIRNQKEEHEVKLQDVVLTKTKQWEKIKHELEVKINNLDQELLRSAAENAALSRSLQERANKLMQVNEDKSRAVAEVEILKSNIESCEREINSLKYELHVVTKELDIRNEEKNMSVRSAEAANKQHMEGVKKIAKLEAECQRLRGLVRKRLPGPAALAQMKLEVESLGREYGDSRLKKSPVKPSSPHVPDSFDGGQKFHKDNEFLTERLLAVEEETKMLKEALAKRNSELLASRNMCAQITNKLHMLEAQSQLNSHNACHPRSLTSMSEDGNDDTRSCPESLATTFVSDVSQTKKGKGSNALELMDDFLEMEKLACSTADSNGIQSHGDKSPDNSKDHSSLENQESPGVRRSDADHGDKLPVMKLQSKISSIFQCMSNENDIKKILDDISHAVHDASRGLHGSSDSKENVSAESNCNVVACSPDVDVSMQQEVTSSQDIKLSSEAIQTISQNLASAISHIRDFVLFLGKEADAVHVISPHGDALRQQIEEFTNSYDKVPCGGMELSDFVLELSRILSKASELKFNVLGYNGAESEINSPDCIDKVALLENEVVPRDSSVDCHSSSSANMSDSTCDPEIPDCGNLSSSFRKSAVSCKLSLEDYAQLKLEKDNMALNLARSTENLESMKAQLQETEQLLSEAKSQLASAQRSNSLSETQLKCMVESYRSLEARAEELEAEVNHLRVKTESLSNELEEEKANHRDALTRCKDLEAQLTRLTSLPETETDLQTKQDRELAAAAEKLAECQETIFLLGRQLQALHPPADVTRKSIGGESQKGEDEPTSSSDKLQELDHGEIDGADSSNPDLPSSLWSPSDAEADNLRSPPTNPMQSRHRPSLSGSSSSSSTTTPEKQSRGFSRFFASKGKNSH